MLSNNLSKLGIWGREKKEIRKLLSAPEDAYDSVIISSHGEFGVADFCKNRLSEYFKSPPIYVNCENIVDLEDDTGDGRVEQYLWEGELARNLCLSVESLHGLELAGCDLGLCKDPRKWADKCASISTDQVLELILHKDWEKGIRRRLLIIDNIGRLCLKEKAYRRGRNADKLDPNNISQLLDAIRHYADHFWTVLITKPYYIESIAKDSVTRDIATSYEFDTLSRDDIQNIKEKAGIAAPVDEIIGTTGGLFTIINELAGSHGSSYDHTCASDRKRNEIVGRYMDNILRQFPDSCYAQLFRIRKGIDKECQWDKAAIKLLDEYGIVDSSNKTEPIVWTWVRENIETWVQDGNNCSPEVYNTLRREELSRDDLFDEDILDFVHARRKELLVPRDKFDLVIDVFFNKLGSGDYKGLRLMTEGDMKVGQRFVFTVLKTNERDDEKKNLSFVLEQEEYDIGAPKEHSWGGTSEDFQFKKASRERHGGIGGWYSNNYFLEDLEKSNKQATLEELDLRSKEYDGWSFKGTKFLEFFLVPTHRKG